MSLVYHLQQYLTLGVLLTMLPTGGRWAAVGGGMARYRRMLGRCRRLGKRK